MYFGESARLTLRVVGVLLLILIGARASSSAQASQSGGVSPQLPIELRNYLKKFIDDAPVDCGQYFLGPSFRQADSDQLQKSIACAIDSGSAHKSSLAFTQGQGIDSIVISGLLGTAAGQIFRFEYDSAPCGGAGCAGRFSIQGCPVPIVVTFRGGYPSLGCRATGASESLD